MFKINHLFIVNGVRCLDLLHTISNKHYEVYAVLVSYYFKLSVLSYT